MLYPASPLPPASSVEAFQLRSTSDRKSTRLNSSHTVISYAVVCLKKKSVLILRWVLSGYGFSSTSLSASEQLLLAVPTRRSSDLVVPVTSWVPLRGDSPLGLGVPAAPGHR